MFFVNQMSTILQLGFIYAVVGLGVFITYKILDFPDLSVDGTFPLGGVVFSVLLTAGCPWPVAMLVSFFAGAAAGLVTGLLHVKLRINGLLAGIITMTALVSVNYLIAGGPQVSFAQEDTLLNNGFVLRQVVEPQPPASMMDLPGMRDEMRRPMMLLVSAQKDDAGL